MHVSHSLLSFAAAAACWTLGGLCQDSPRTIQGGVEPHNPLAVSRSAYGSLLARLMKDSLHSYWHAGCTDPTHDHAPATASPAAPGAGRFSSRQAPKPPPVAAPHVCMDNCCRPSGVAPDRDSWVDRCGKSVSQMEHMRTVRNSPFAVAPTHRLFLSASADWRVHLAWQLDPGDAALYEIDHFVSRSRAPSAEAAKQKADELAQRTIQHALSPQAGLADALTGAGAIINKLNDELRPGRPVPPKTEEMLRDWRVLTFCLNRHRELREQANEEDWWSDIPEVRRSELETYATMLTRLSNIIQQQLANNGTLQQ